MEVLDAQEEIEEAQEEEALVELRERNEKKVEDSVRALEGYFARDDLEGARREAVRLRYWLNIRNSLNN